MDPASSAIPQGHGGDLVGDDACREGKRNERRALSDENACRVAVARAIRLGQLPAEPPFCEVCGVAGKRSERAVLPRRNGQPRRGRWSIVLHHHSLEPAFWLDVVPVCDSCHTRIHLGQIAEPRTGEVRSGDRVKRSAGCARPHRPSTPVDPDAEFGTNHPHRLAPPRAGGAA